MAVRTVAGASAKTDIPFGLASAARTSLKRASAALLAMYPEKQKYENLNRFCDVHAATIRPLQTFDC
jgi:hypothetical protein